METIKQLKAKKNLWDNLESIRIRQRRVSIQNVEKNSLNANLLNGIIRMRSSSRKHTVINCYEQAINVFVFILAFTVEQRLCSDCLLLVCELY